MEQTHYNLLFRWFVGLSIDDSVWNHSTFSKNGDRLLEHAVAPGLFAKAIRMAGQPGLLSADHFSVDGTLIQACASHKSFRPKDDGPGAVGRNRERDFRGEVRANDTHALTTDPAARLYRKSSNTAALCYEGHTVVENRHRLVMQAEVSHATGTAERDTALKLLATLPGQRRKTVAADKAYDVVCRRLPTLAQHPTRGCQGQGSAMDQRTLRHVGYAISQVKRKRVEEPPGWMKLIAQLRQVKQRGKAQVEALFQMGMLGWNLVRMRNLLAGATT